MKNRTVTITVSASYEEVFDFLANPETLPVWAKSFAASVTKSAEGWLIQTPQGKGLPFAIDSDRSSGCIEMLAGPKPEFMESFPIRVFKADSGETAVSFTMFKSQRPDMTDAMFDMHYRTLVKEVESLIPRFGGGELSSGLPEPSAICMGIVTDSLAVSRDFYVTHFGFQVVFDSPCYVHLVREAVGEQIGLMAASEDAGQRELEKGTNGIGLWLTLYVSDVDAEFERLKANGLEIREELIDQPWGERTFVVVDPNGVLIYVSQQTGKMDDSLQQFVVKGEGELVS